MDSRCFICLGEKRLQVPPTLRQDLGAVSIHTTAALTTNCVMELVPYPEYATMLGEEGWKVLDATAGEWTSDSMTGLKMMDSSTKETQRHGGAAIVAFQRNPIRDITLSDETFIPRGNYIWAPSEAISADPSIYDEPEKFDGLKFYKMRATDENKHLVVSSSPIQLHFGTGRQGCPVR